MTNKELDKEQVDRAIGAVLGAVAGEALALPYADDPELMKAIEAGGEVKMTESWEW